jgi:hypothetical protein
MSLLAEIVDEKVSLQPVRQSESELEKISPCSVCGFPILWLSVYRDGVLRCCECEPPPSRALVARKVLVTPDGSIDPAAADPEQPLVVIGHKQTDPLALLMYVPWPDWSKKPGSWRRDAPANPADDPLEQAADPDSDQPAISIELVRQATSQASRRALPEPPPHREPDPGCLRDYRGEGGTCSHPLADQRAKFVESYTKTVGKGDKRTEKRFNQMRVTCSCGKFVGYRSDPVG